MDVTKSNFNECVDEISNAIKQASFIAFDGEFTGLDVQKYGKVLPFDTPSERYTKLRKGAMDYLIVQFGLCTFRFDNKKKKLIANPYNFYIFPRPYSRQAPDATFLCQSSSIDFLVSQGFDFNKVFYEGISYLTPAQENTLKETMEYKHLLHSQFSSPAFTSPHGQEPGPNKGPIAIPDDQKQFIDSIVEKITTFMDKPEEESLNLPPCNGFQRKLIYQTIRAKETLTDIPRFHLVKVWENPSGFKPMVALQYKPFFDRFTSVHLEAKKGVDRERYICVTKVSGEEDLKMREGAKQAAERAEIDDAVGFSKIIRMISQSGKVLVGHNMLLDVMHTIHQFHYPLPEDYEDFKSLTKCIFPKLIDTKLMAQNHPFKDYVLSSALNDLHKLLSSKPFSLPEVEFPTGFTNYTDNNKYHEAGYDAFVTGICFASMKNFLGTFLKPPKDFVSPTSPLVEPYLNKLFMLRNFEVPYLNLNGPDLTMNRDHVFHMTFPKDWKTNDLSQLFTLHGNVQVFWLDETSALIALYKKENSKSAFEDLSKQQASFTIQTYQQFLKPANDNGGGSGKQREQTARKRSCEESEADVPLKKRKTLNVQAEPFVSKKSDATSEGDENSNSSSKDITMDEQTDNIDKEKAEKSNKLFPESENW